MHLFYKTSRAGTAPRPGGGTIPPRTHRAPRKPTHPPASNKPPIPPPRLPFPQALSSPLAPAPAAPTASHRPPQDPHQCAATPPPCRAPPRAEHRARVTQRLSCRWVWVVGSARTRTRRTTARSSIRQHRQEQTHLRGYRPRRRDHPQEITRSHGALWHQERYGATRAAAGVYRRRHRGHRLGIRVCRDRGRRR